MSQPPTPTSSDLFSARILIVDDQEANVAVLRALLTQAGYTNLTSLTDPREVALLCATLQPDLILLDLQMPHLDGFAVLAELRQIIPADCYLPILVLTADITVAARRRALEDGAHDFLSKPFDRTEVLLRVRNLLQTRALYRGHQDRQQALVAQAVELREQLAHDPVTGLPTRAHVQQTLEAALPPGQAPAPLALLLVQCAGLADAMGTLRHTTANQALDEIATRLSALRRPADTVARVGDAQFALVLPGMRTAAALWAARKVLSALAPPLSDASEALSLESAVGVALAPDHGVDADALFRAATAALNVAARSPESYSLYDLARYDQQMAQRHRLLAELRQAVGRNQLVLHYQPKLDLTMGRGRVTGVEALLRWEHPAQGLLGPDQFIGLVEQHGLIGPVTQWVVEAALRQADAWQQIGLPLEVALNVSMRSLADPRFPEMVSTLIEQHGLAPQLLTLEVTESALMVEPEQTLRALQQLAALGVGLAIDDFGTGYSSLSRLRQLPLRELKIDRSFVQQMSAVAEDRAIVETVIALGHKLGLRVVAEGVEDQRTLNLLRDEGCDQVQGYYVTRPLPSGEFKRWLDRSPWGLQQIVA